jgi:hypothetical protein
MPSVDLTIEMPGMKQTFLTPKQNRGVKTGFNLGSQERTFLNL